MDLVSVWQQPIGSRREVERPARGCCRNLPESRRWKKMEVLKYTFILEPRILYGYLLRIVMWERRAKKPRASRSFSHGNWRKWTITHQDEESHKNDEDKEFSLGLLAYDACSSLSLRSLLHKCWTYRHGQGKGRDSAERDGLISSGDKKADGIEL